MHTLIVAALFAQSPGLDGITTKADWEKRRAAIIKGMEAAMGKLPERPKGLESKMGGVQVNTEKYVRTKYLLETEKGVWMPVWLMEPKGFKKPLPAVLCLHQTTAIGKGEPAGLNKNEQLHYALHLVERGYVCLVPDYPSFGEYKYDFKTSKFKSGTMKAIWDNMAAVDFLSAHPNVDPERIGVIGHSLGGHNAMFTACFDTRLRAVVSNCGFTSFPKYYGGKIKGWTSDRYMPRLDTAYKLDVKKVPFDFPEIVAAIAPRAFLASSPLHDDNFEVSGVKDCIAAARPIYKLLGVEGNLQANYPDCKHEFPPAVRKVAYEFLDKHLKGKR